MAAAIVFDCPNRPIDVTSGLLREGSNIYQPLLRTSARPRGAN